MVCPIREKESEIYSNAITYDANGNMTSLLDKKIRRITYNILNLPKAVDMMNPSTGRLALEYGHYISYGYRADGAKIGKVLNYSSEYVGGSYSEKWDYLDGFQYRFFKYLGTREEPILEIDLETGQTIKKTKDDFVLQFFPTSEGYYDYLHKRYVYHYIDHLGNVRLSYYRSSNGNLTIDKESNYYPFGLEHTGYNGLLGNQSYNYKYNGKELQETGMYAMDFRHYMPDIGRFSAVDELLEINADFTPYHFADNNPIRFSDPTGLYTRDANGNISTSNQDEIRELMGYFRGGGSINNVDNFINGNSNFALDIPELTLSGTKSFFGFSFNNGYKSIFNHLNKHIGSMATISKWDGDKGYWGNLSSSNEPLHQLVYGILNDFYIMAQVLDTGNWLGAKNYNSPTGNLAFTNLDGSGQFNANDRGVTFATTVLPVALKGVNVELNMVKNSVLKTMNAAQYNKLFKGTFITKMEPKLRGVFYKTINNNKKDVNIIVKWLSDPLNMNSAKQAVENAEKNSK
ncbi:hypothetical protein PG326_02900 [Riemerella anatipestifer]|nr:hypothetical protein [Riemerella anatipestifer]MDY3357285.1 hypothetical protein [Riemerella anatipestifer]